MSDTELVGCPICKGRKTLVGLGHIPIDCHQCNGIGWIEKVCDKAEDAFLGVSDDPVAALSERATYQEIDQPKKKSGRSKKAS